MIALAILAVVASALIKSASMSVYQARSVETRTVALWVAENRMNELRTGVRNPADFPSAGTRREAVAMAGQAFDLEVRTINTENENVRRVEVNVYRSGEDETPLGSLSGFLGRY